MKAQHTFHSKLRIRIFEMTIYFCIVSILFSGKVQTLWYCFGYSFKHKTITWILICANLLGKHFLLLFR